MSSGRVDDEIAEAEKKMFAAFHISTSYAQRAAQLKYWKRTIDFISLGVAPGILGALADKTYGGDKTYGLAIGLAVAGACSSAAYIWTAFGFAFQWDRQLEVAQSAATRSRQVYRQLRTLLADVRGRKAKQGGKPEELLPSIGRVTDQYEEIYDEIQSANVTIYPWMTLRAQQETMVDLGTSCSVCGAQWDRTKDRLYTEKEAKQFLQNKYDLYPKHCITCGLVRQ